MTTTAKQVIQEDGSVPIKIWTNDVEIEVLQQLKNIARLPFISRQGLAVMPDCHAGRGSTVGTVVGTERAIVPAMCGVDIGCGMVAVRLSLKGSQLPDNLKSLRLQIERDVPTGRGIHNDAHLPSVYKLNESAPSQIVTDIVGDADKFKKKIASQLGTLGSGNHFIELCIDENDDVWVMLHSGSRGIGNLIGSYFIEKAKRHMEQYFVTLPDADLAYLPEDTQDFKDYVEAVDWAQNYAFKNRAKMMEVVLAAVQRCIPTPFTITQEAINCHHNYISRENHFGRNMWVTRKGAIRARKDDLGIIPSAMGQTSFIVRGKGNLEAYCSCSHGSGRKMSRTKAKELFTSLDLEKQTEGVECRKTSEFVDEIPSAYKDIEKVMDNQRDLVEVVHRLKAVLCVKGAS